MRFTFPGVVALQQNFHTPGHSPRQWNIVDLTGHSTFHHALSAKLQSTKTQLECREAEWKDWCRVEPFPICLSSTSPSSTLSVPASLKSQIHHVLCPSMPLHMLFPLPEKTSSTSLVHFYQSSFQVSLTCHPPKETFSDGYPGQISLWSCSEHHELPHWVSYGITSHS